MKIAAAKAIAGLISEEELTEEYVIPAAFDERVGKSSGRGGCKGGKEKRSWGKNREKQNRREIRMASFVIDSDCLRTNMEHRK